MAQLTQETRDAVSTGLQMVAQAALLSETGLAPGRIGGAELLRLCEVVPTPNETSRKHIMRALPNGVEQWAEGARRPAKQRHEPLEKEIVNYRYVTPVEEFNFRGKNVDQIIGSQEALVAEHALSMRQDREERIVDVLNGGFAELCHDGQFFFDTDHSFGDSGTWDNKSTTAYGVTALKAEIELFMARLGSNGKPLGLFPDLLIVAHDDYFQAVQDVNSAEIRDTTSSTLYRTGNPLQKIIEVRWSPFVDPDNWYLLCTSRQLKPIILQEELPITFEMDDSLFFDYETLRYSLKKYEGYGTGYAELGTGSTGGS
jgi:hypothetical protein